MAEKTIDIAQPVLSRNERIADRLRTRFSESGVFVVNVLSSPGSGKTTTILASKMCIRDRPRPYRVRDGGASISIRTLGAEPRLSRSERLQMCIRDRPR